MGLFAMGPKLACHALSLRTIPDDYLAFSGFYKTYAAMGEIIFQDLRNFDFI
jgi:hypothetical protein